MKTKKEIKEKMRIAKKLEKDFIERAYKPNYNKDSCFRIAREFKAEFNVLEWVLEAPTPPKG